MGYVDQNLLPGENVIYRATLHPIIFAAPIVLGLTGVILMVLGLINQEARIFVGIGMIFLLVGGCAGLSSFVMRKSSEFAVTDKRVIIKVGLIRRHTLELLIAKVETVGVDQSIIGRLLDYGTIIVTGTGGTKEPFKNIAQPLEFRRQVQSRVTTQ